jgi:hypothetical protein
MKETSTKSRVPRTPGLQHPLPYQPLLPPRVIVGRKTCASPASKSARAQRLEGIDLDDASSG